MALDEAPGITTLGVSTYRETPPVGGPAGQGPFLNAAAALLTTLAPEELLDVLASIEARAGRARVIRWGERVTPKAISPVELPPCEKTALEMVREFMASKGVPGGVTPGLDPSLAA